MSLRGQTGRFPEAIDHLRLAIRHSPSNSSAHNNPGTALASSGQINESIPHFVKAAELNPAYAEAWGNLGAAYLQQGRPAEAIAPLERALALNPDLRNFPALPHPRPPAGLGTTIIIGWKLRWRSAAGTARKNCESALKPERHQRLLGGCFGRAGL